MSIQYPQLDNSLATKMFPAGRRGLQKRDTPRVPLLLLLYLQPQNGQGDHEPWKHVVSCGIIGATPFRKLSRWRATEFDGRTPGGLAGNARRVVEVPAGLDVRLVGLSQTKLASELTRLETAVHWNRRLADEI